MVKNDEMKMKMKSFEVIMTEKAEIIYKTLSEINLQVIKLMAEYESWLRDHYSQMEEIKKSNKNNGGK